MIFQAVIQSEFFGHMFLIEFGLTGKIKNVNKKCKAIVILISCLLLGITYILQGVPLVTGNNTTGCPNFDQEYRVSKPFSGSRPQEQQYRKHRNPNYKHTNNALKKLTGLIFKEIFPYLLLSPLIYKCILQFLFTFFSNWILSCQRLKVHFKET